MKFYKTITVLFIAIFILQIGCKKKTDAVVQKPAIETMVATSPILNPFAENNGLYPPANEYNGPFFKANFDYPSQVPAKQYPWEKVLNGQPLNKKNAEKYIMAVREYIAADMRLMINEPATWLTSPNKKNWYNMAWSGQSFDSTGWEGLETVYGTMTGQVVKNDVFKNYGFEGPMQNHALVYYNDVSAVTLNKLWKSKSPSGFFPDYTTEAAQFMQNAIVIKAAGATATPEQWPSVLKGAGTFPIYREVAFGPEKGKGQILQQLTWLQFDIIIKDTIASPGNGWVFSTFIYDVNSPGKNTFDRLTLLGVSWGNDPGKMKGNEILEETYLNPKAPAYAAATIGYGKRLAGPIDIALVGGTLADGTIDSIYVQNANKQQPGKKYLHFTASSCFSCHGTASWPSQNDFYPSPNARHQLVFSDTLYNPASREWSNYYQNRPGTEIMKSDNGENNSTMALDYDLFMLFALNNSLLGQKHPPKTESIPAGYKKWDIEKHGPQMKRRSK